MSPHRACCVTRACCPAGACLQTLKEQLSAQLGSTQYALEEARSGIEGLRQEMQMLQEVGGVVTRRWRGGGGRSDVSCWCADRVRACAGRDVAAVLLDADARGRSSMPRRVKRKRHNDSSMTSL